MKKIGIIGGMGPEAAIELQWLILRAAQELGATSDHTVPPMLIDQNTTIPNRTTAICDKGQSPLPQMIASLKTLESGGVDFAVMPCITAHHWLEQLQAASMVPVIDMVELLLEAVEKSYGHINKWLVLATAGTSATRLFPAHTNLKQTLTRLEAGSEDEASVMAAIYNPRYGIKAGFRLEDDTALRQDFGASPTSLLHGVIDRYRVMHGCTGVILACTELPLAVDRYALERSGMAVLDPLEITARVSAEIAMGWRKLPKSRKRTHIKLIHGANDA